jgi:hypothetical protein
VHLEGEEAELLETSSLADLTNVKKTAAGARPAAECQQLELFG